MNERTFNEYTVDDLAAAALGRNATSAATGDLRTASASSPHVLGPRVLAIGSTETAVAHLHLALRTLHPRMDRAPDEPTACTHLTEQQYDLVVVLAAAGDDGEALCRHLRVMDRRVPLLVLASTAGDAVAVLAAGADSYLVEPIAAAELRARCAALLRRHGITAPPVGAAPVVPHQADLTQTVTAQVPEQRGSITGALRATRAQAVRVLAALTLVLAGVLGARVFETTQTPTGTATAASVASASSATITTSASVDAAAEQAFAVASPSVVYISNVGIGSGSGVIYDSTGDIVTNAHVVAGAQTLRVTLSTGKTYTARLVGMDTADDLAVIHINATGLPSARFAAAGTYKVAQTVLAIGSPLGLQESVTSGLVSALNRTVQESTGAYLPNAVQTSAPINPGNSGGALITLDGTVIGIPTLQASDAQNNNGGAAQGIGFAVPSQRVTYVARQIMATGTVAHTGRAYLGVSATDASSASAASSFYGGGTTSTVEGALVQQAGSGSPAEAAGVQAGDVITAINGKAISGEADLLSALAAARPGSTMTLTLNRTGTSISVRVHLGEMPAS